MILVPVRVGFAWRACLFDADWFWDLFVDFCFAVDIVVTFRTAIIMDAAERNQQVGGGDRRRRCASTSTRTCRASTRTRTRTRSVSTRTRCASTRTRRASTRATRSPAARAVSSSVLLRARLSTACNLSVPSR